MIGADWGRESLFICFQWIAYDGAAEWCARVAEEHGITSSFYDGLQCPDTGTDGTFGPCAIEGALAGDDHEVDVEVYYYTPDWTSETAAEACLDAGGTLID